MPKFAPQLELTFDRARRAALYRGSAAVTTDHLLLALLDDPDASPVLSSLGADMAAVRQHLELHLGPRLSVAAPQDMNDPPAATGFRYVVERAIVHCATTGREEILGTNILVALFFDTTSIAVQLLNGAGLSRFAVVQFLFMGPERHV